MGMHPGLLWSFIAFVSLALVLGVSVYIQPRPIVHLIANLNPQVMFYVPTREKIVALTIDDAPTKYDTKEILDVLQENGAHATFFCIGHNIIHEDPTGDILKRMHNDGHELANHMFEDKPSYQLSEEEFETQLVTVDRLIQNVTQHSNDSINNTSTKWFRPGHGFFTKKMIEQVSTHGYRTALGSVYPHDPAISFSSINSLFVLNRVHPGAVVILHNRPWTISTLKTILPRLKDMGYKVTTLSGLLQYDTSAFKSD